MTRPGKITGFEPGSSAPGEDSLTTRPARRLKSIKIRQTSRPFSDTLAGNGYYLNVDRVFLGGKDGSSNRYIGYLQNFHLGDLDLLGEARKTGSSLDVNVFDVLPPLIYHPVTIPDLDAFVSLPPLQGEQNMALRFMFKTEVGVLLMYRLRHRPRRT